MGAQMSNVAVVWDEEHGLRTVADVLLDRGVDLLGVELLTAEISSDGSTLVGQAHDRDGGFVAWIARTTADVGQRPQSTTVGPQHACERGGRTHVGREVNMTTHLTDSDKRISEEADRGIDTAMLVTRTPAGGIGRGRWRSGSDSNGVLHFANAIAPRGPQLPRSRVTISMQNARDS